MIEKIPFPLRTGYACINMTLSAKGIMTNRDAKLKTLNSKGISHISNLALQNVTDLFKIVKWNAENQIYYYRISSGLFPWMTSYEFEELPDWESIKNILQEIGIFVKTNNQRLEFHPSHFTILASPSEKTVEKSLKDLNQHSKIFDAMGLQPSHWNPLNIHVGGAYGNKEDATKRWCENFLRLDANTQKRVVVENDDKANMYSVNDLYNLIWKNVNVPITFDVFHHGFCTGNLSINDAAQLAKSTWNTTPMSIHWSSSMKTHENPNVKSVAHADWIWDELDDWGTDGWFMCESKAKELSILDYFKNGKKQKI